MILLGVEDELFELREQHDKMKSLLKTDIRDEYDNNCYTKI